MIIHNIAGCIEQVVGAGKCCQNHPKLGRCLPGQDDSPEKNGKCWNFCISDCEKGGFCKQVGKGHVCHCYC